MAVKDRLIESGILKDLVGEFLGRAGRSKDDIIQVLGREIGIALAAVLKEPLDKAVNSKKIQISIELANKDEVPSAGKKKKKKTKKKAS